MASKQIKDFEQIKLLVELIEGQQKLIFLLNQKDTNFIFFSSLLFTAFISFIVAIPAWRYFVYFAVITAAILGIAWMTFNLDKKRRKREAFERLVEAYRKNGLTDEQIKEFLPLQFAVY